MKISSLSCVFFITNPNSKEDMITTEDRACTQCGRLVKPGHLAKSATRFLCESCYGDIKSKKAVGWVIFAFMAIVILVIVTVNGG